MGNNYDLWAESLNANILACIIMSFIDYRIENNVRVVVSKIR
jgi:hypothetical protein